MGSRAMLHLVHAWGSNQLGLKATYGINPLRRARVKGVTAIYTINSNTVKYGLPRRLCGRGVSPCAPWDGATVHFDFTTFESQNYGSLAGFGQFIQERTLTHTLFLSLSLSLSLSHSLSHRERERVREREKERELTPATILK